MRRLFLLSISILVATPLASLGSSETYTIDPVHSSVIFRVNHLGVSYFYGRFNEVSGSFTVADPIEKSSVEVTIKASSVDTHDKKRDGHLTSPDFLDAKTFPVIKFTGKKFRKRSDGKIEVEGDLFLHGVTRPLSLVLTPVGEGKDPWGGYRKGFEGRVTLKRSDFGMKFMIPGVGDEVTLILGIEGVRK